MSKRKPVFVVFHEMEYEGREPLGIHASREGAISAVEKVVEGDPRSEWKRVGPDSDLWQGKAAVSLVIEEWEMES